MFGGDVTGKLSWLTGLAEFRTKQAFFSLQ